MESYNNGENVALEFILQTKGINAEIGMLQLATPMNIDL